LSARENQNNISLFNNKFNKEIINDYGGKNAVFAALERQNTMSTNSSKSKQAPNKPAANVAPASSSLNKLFTQTNDLKAKTTSPNKLFIFKVRNKKDN